MMQYSPNNLLRMVKFVRRHFQHRVTQLLDCSLKSHAQSYLLIYKLTALSDFESRLADYFG